MTQQPTLDVRHRSLPLPGIPAGTTSRGRYRNHAMTGNEQWPGVGPTGLSHSPRRGPDGVGNIGIAAGFPDRDSTEGFPHLAGMRTTGRNRRWWTPVRGITQIIEGIEGDFHRNRGRRLAQRAIERRAEACWQSLRVPGRRFGARIGSQPVGEQQPMARRAGTDELQRPLWNEAAPEVDGHQARGVRHRRPNQRAALTSSLIRAALPVRSRR